MTRAWLEETKVPNLHRTMFSIQKDYQPIWEGLEIDRHQETCSWCTALASRAGAKKQKRRTHQYFACSLRFRHLLLLRPLLLWGTLCQNTQKFGLLRVTVRVSGLNLSMLDHVRAPQGVQGPFPGPMGPARRHSGTTQADSWNVSVIVNASSFFHGSFFTGMLLVLKRFVM